ncbi:Hypothetical protein UVM_LOCUS511 [uncultured virus]|nr:Hypothetical protein UVM_LOCUS511 [uncultured virus]
MQARTPTRVGVGGDAPSVAFASVTSPERRTYDETLRSRASMPGLLLAASDAGRASLVPVARRWSPSAPPVSPPAPSSIERAATIADANHDSVFNILAPKPPQQVSARELRGLMPRGGPALRSSIVDTIWNDCVRHMRNEARDKSQPCCSYTIPDLVPGLPLYDPAEVMNQLFVRLLQSDGLLAYADKSKPNTLIISWAA